MEKEKIMEIAKKLARMTYEHEDPGGRRWPTFEEYWQRNAAWFERRTEAYLNIRELLGEQTRLEVLEKALRRIAGFSSRFGPSDEATLAQHALEILDKDEKEEVPHVDNNG